MRFSLTHQSEILDVDIVADRYTEDRPEQSEQAASNLTRVTSRGLLGQAGPTLFPGTYTITNTGRPCRSFLSVAASCSNNLIDTWYVLETSLPAPRLSPSWTPKCCERAGCGARFRS